MGDLQSRVPYHKAGFLTTKSPMIPEGGLQVGLMFMANILNLGGAPQYSYAI